MTLLIIVTTLATCIVYALEPRWRMRSLTSLGLYISSRVHNVSLSSVAAFFSIIAFHFVQLVLVFGTGWLFLRLFVDFGYNVNYNYDLVPILQAFGFLIVLGVVFIFYRLSERWARHAALRFAFRSDL